VPALAPFQFCAQEQSQFTSIVGRLIIDATDGAMSQEDASALLREVLERQKSIEQRLEQMQAAEQERAKVYAETDDLYRKEIAEYKQRVAQREKCEYCDAIQAAVRVLILLLLAYVAYRLS
jgi:hypothetical protein